MKRIFSVLAFAIFFVPSVRADLTLEQSIEGGVQSGQLVMRVKGDKFRIDLPGGPAGPMSTIVDIKSGDTITLLHQKKIALTRSGAQIRQAQEARAKIGGEDPKKIEPPKPAATGRTERVGDHDAEIYTMEVENSTETIWVVNNFPNFESIKEDLARISKNPAGGASHAATLDVTSLPGMVVKRQKERGGQKMTITLTNVKRDALDDSLFVAPLEYKAVIPPPEPIAPK